MSKSVPRRAQISTVTKYDRQKAQQKRLVDRNINVCSQMVTIWSQLSKALLA